MAGSSTPAHNIYQTVAAQQTAQATRTISEQIFQDALEQVLNQNAKKKTELLHKLQSVHTEKEVIQNLENDLQKSKFFGPGAPEGLSRKVSKVAEHIWNAKPVVDKFMSINSAATTPIWGTMLFVIMVVRNIHALDDLLEELKETMETHLETFNEHFMRHPGISKSMRNSLRKFYASIITYCVKVSPLLKAPIIKIYAKNYTGQAKDGLEGLLKKMNSAAAQVYNAATAGTYSRIEDMQEDQMEASASDMQPQTAQQGKIKSVPWKLSPFFTGREDVLALMRSTLGGFDDAAPRELALWGMPGAGKSQTSLQLSKDWTAESTSPCIYQHVIGIRANGKEVLEREVRRVMVSLRPQAQRLHKAPISFVIEHFLQWLKSHDRWLLIFDNVLDANDVVPFSPVQGRGHVIYSTRRKFTALRLCDVATATEMWLMNQTDGTTLVKNLMGLDYHEGLQNDAKDVADFCRGLPLAIETLVNLALKNGITLASALKLVSDKAKLLKQNPGNSFHEDNASVGGILITSLEMMKQKSDRACALFMLMVYREPSLIQVSTMSTGTAIEIHFARPETYDRGCIRTHEGSALRKKWLGPQKIDLSDHEPFELDIWQRLFHLSFYKSKYWQPDLPRIDSTSDIALKKYWVSNQALRHVLSDQDQLDNALTQLEGTGLIRRVQDQKDTFWIHDLLAELTTAYIADQSKEWNQNAAHLAAATVFLSLPVPNFRWNDPEAYLVGLPHAESALKHLRESGIFNDTTIGAELAHVIASILHLKMKLWGEVSNLGKIVECFRVAFEGYYAAWGRLMQHPSIKKQKDKAIERIVIATLADQAREVGCQPLGRFRDLWDATRYIYQYERVGSSAAWRCLGAMFKLGTVLVEQDKGIEGLWFAEKGLVGIEVIFGKFHEEAIAARDFVMDLYGKAGMWKKQLEMCEGERNLLESKSGKGWMVSFDGVKLMEKTAMACQELGRWREAVKWFELSYEWHKDWYGQSSRLCFDVVVKLTRCYARQEDWERSVYWWFEAFKLIFWADDCEEGEDGYRRVASVEDVIVDECVAE